MAQDGLDPGRGARRAAGSRVPSVRKMAWTGVGLVVLVSLGWLAIADDPLGGEPVSVVSLERMTPQADTGEDIGIRDSVDSAEAEPLPEGQALPPADIVISDPMSRSAQAGQPLGTSAEIAAGAEPGLIEMSRHGPLPTIAADGRKAVEAYAGPRPSGVASRPRVAVVVSGMGLSATGSEAAIDGLPAEISLAFAPYGSDMARLTGRARQAGHELLLHIPLEPYDYPDNDPGPHTLLTGLDPEQNRDRLYWVMSRFTGYMGVVNYMGSRFTASDAAVRPLLGEIRDRGLAYFDDGSSPRSVAGTVARDIGLPFAGVDVVIDAVPSREAVDAALAKLEAAARDKGGAIGIASGLPVSIDAIREWAEGLEARGVVLVPASALIAAGAT